MNPISLARRAIGWVHKQIDPIGHARSIGVTIGDHSRLVHVSFGSEPWLIRIGEHFSGTWVSFVTHDGGVWVLRRSHPDIDRLAPIIVGDNVFIGSNTVILPGVTIGDNVVIGAGSVVSKDIPSDCVAAGVPARPIKPLSEYAAKVVASSDPTKQMSPADKKAFYLQKYADTLGGKT